METAFEPRELRDVFGSYPTGVIALATAIDGEPTGIAASSFVPVSLVPPLLAVCIAMSSSTWPKMRNADSFGLSVLSEKHDEASRRLASKEVDRFESIDWFST